jgi:gamma-glutamyltranspeptidase/glutathione hydrolase
VTGAFRGAVAAADRLAAHAGAELLARGGNAVDASLAAAAVMAVTAPHMGGLGGDLFAVIKEPGISPLVVNASGRAGSGADPERLRADGKTEMPFRHDISAVTVPGFVAGVTALHERFAALPLSEALMAACKLAREGFPVSPLLARASLVLEPDERESAFGGTAPLRAGRRLALPRLADVFDAIAERGATGFYGGSAGAALLELGGGEFTEADLDGARAELLPALGLRAFEHELWTAPPNSQGYLALAGAWIAERLEPPAGPADGDWAVLLVEAARHAAFDRGEVLHEHADGSALLAERRLAQRVEAIGRAPARRLGDAYRDGGTAHICAIDGDTCGVSLIMSNAAGFGSHLTLPRHGIFLHNRGIGFSLRPGHPAEYGPRRRPPHTLAPLLTTSADGALAAVLGTMGGDAQPQILLQVLARMFAAGQGPQEALAAPRWILSGEGGNGFDTWREDGLPIVRLEHDCPRSWASGLKARGYRVEFARVGDQAFGHAQAIRIKADGELEGATDPRAEVGAVAGD